MRMQLAVKQRFIDFLDKHLCSKSNEHYQFMKVGPRSFFFKDDIDTVFVKVTDENLIIITDGENVIDHTEMIFLSLYSYDENDEEDLFDSYLQMILHKF